MQHLALTALQIQIGILLYLENLLEIRIMLFRMERWKQGNFTLWIIQSQPGKIAIHEPMLWQSLHRASITLVIFISLSTISFSVTQLVPEGSASQTKVARIGNNLNVLQFQIAVSTRCLFPQTIKTTFMMISVRLFDQMN